MPIPNMSSSTNDQTSVASHFGGSSFGGLNINRGIKSEWVVVGVIVIAALWFFKGRK